MTMTRKDYRVIARALNDVKPVDMYPYEGRAIWQRTVHQVTSALAAHYDNFDAVKFANACIKGKGV